MAAPVTAIFDNHFAATEAVSSLRSAGFPESDISILTSDTQTTRNTFGVTTKTKASEGVAIGAGVGGAVVALVAGLTAVGAIATGGLGLLAAGPIVAALAGAGAGAAAGGLLGGMIGLGIPEHEAKFYEDKIAKGGVLVGVLADGDRIKTAKEILKARGGENVTKG